MIKEVPEVNSFPDLQKWTSAPRFLVVKVKGFRTFYRFVPPRTFISRRPLHVVIQVSGQKSLNTYAKMQKSRSMYL